MVLDISFKRLPELQQVSASLQWWLAGLQRDGDDEQWRVLVAILSKHPGDVSVFWEAQQNTLNSRKVRKCWHV